MSEVPREDIAFDEWLQEHGFEDAHAQLRRLEKEMEPVHAMDDEDFIGWFPREWQSLYERAQRFVDDKPDFPLGPIALAQVELLALNYYTHLAASDNPRMIHRAKQHGENTILTLREVINFLSQHTHVPEIRGFMLARKLELAKALLEVSFIDISMQLTDVNFDGQFETLMEQLARHPEIRFNDGFPHRRLQEMLDILNECTDDEKYFADNVTEEGIYYFFEVLSAVAYIQGEEVLFRHITEDVGRHRNTSEEFEALYQRCRNGPEFLHRTKTAAPTLRLISPEHQEKTTSKRCARSIDPILAKAPQKLEEYDRAMDLAEQIINDEFSDSDGNEAQLRFCLEKWQALAKRDGMRLAHLVMISDVAIALQHFLQTRIDKGAVDVSVEQFERNVALAKDTQLTISAAIDNFESTSGENIEDDSIANCFVLSILFTNAAEIIFDKIYIYWLKAGLSRPADVDLDFIIDAVKHKAIRPHFQRICEELQPTFRHLSAFYTDKIFMCTRGDTLGVLTCAIFKALSEGDLEHARQLYFHLGRFTVPSSEA